jgi:outer membrane biosynthesis protein TonB
MATYSYDNTQGKIRGISISTVIHVSLLLLFFLYRFSVPQLNPPPPEPGGVLVALGEPDRGQGADPAPQGQQMDDPRSTKEVPKPKPEAKPAKPTSKPVAQPTPNPTPKNTPSKPASSSVTTEDPAAEVRRRQQDEAKAAKAREAAAAAASAKAKADADAKAAANAKAAAEAKGKYGSKFGQGTGQGQGNTGKPGNQGVPDGDPNSKNLEGVSGSGQVGGGLGGRKISKRPGKIVDNTNAVGKVVVYICVDSDGRVTSARFQQQGSTTTNTTLINKAIENAKQYQFGAEAADNACGTVTYNFVAQ